MSYKIQKEEEATSRMWYSRHSGHYLRNTTQHKCQNPESPKRTVYWLQSIWKYMEEEIQTVLPQYAVTTSALPCFLWKEGEIHHFMLTTITNKPITSSANNIKSTEKWGTKKLPAGNMNIKWPQHMNNIY